MRNILDKKITSIARTALHKAKDEYNRSLDFSEDSLVLLEQIISVESKLYSLEDYEIEEGKNSSRLWGVFLGEVIRKNLGGDWSVSDNLIILSIKGNVISPIEYVEDRLFRRIELSLFSYYSDLFERIRGYSTLKFSSEIEKEKQNKIADVKNKQQQNTIDGLRNDFQYKKPSPTVLNPGMVRCKACRKEVSQVADSCPHCGIGLPGLDIKCPRCNSNNITSSKKGFGLGEAAAGLVLVGPVGLLGGIIGKDAIRLQCKDCGKKWEPST